jgi:Tol biopolymer transport system component
MPERWRTELRKINHLHPDEDLVDRALARPRRKAPVRRLTTRIATVAFALILPAALIVGAIRIAGGRSTQAPAAERSSVAVPPTNGELLYTKRLSDGWSLFALDPSTGVERQITHGYRDYGSDWSPDGTKIVYDSESPSGSGDYGIWVVNADGSNPTKLIDDGSVPAWSPDGNEIAFARADPGTFVPAGNNAVGTGFSIYVMDADGTNVHRLTSAVHEDFAPAWSPDGTHIAFLRSGEGVFVMNADGTGQRQLTGPEIEVFGAPDWSPDGATLVIAVNGTKGGAPGGIMLVPADGSGGPTMVPGTEATYPNYVSNPAWSPDGEWIAYTPGGRAGGIVIAHPDGSDPRTLAVDPATDTIEELAWGAAPGSPAP